LSALRSIWSSSNDTVWLQCEWQFRKHDGREEVRLDLAAAADELATEGWEIEVIDLRTIKPLDTDTVLASVARTGRVLAVGEAWPWGGVTAEILARVAAEGFNLLDAPPMRLNSKDTPVPYHPNLWGTHRPTARSIADSLRVLLRS
jgi:pyruvate dehydrogenase E1 component beta subunit/2-oxoisovalerate dehydrogenase E1 component beta subunit